jgi:hypothetical protein
MKNNKHCKSENRRAHQFNANHLHGRCCKTSSNSFMNIRIFLGLCVVLGAGFISVRAADNPAQAAARVALEQKLSQPDAWEPQPLTAAPTPSVAVVQQPGKSAANVTGTVAEKAVTPQTDLAPTTPVPALVAVVPAAVAPVTSVLMLSFLMLSFLILSLLLLKFLRQNSRSYGSNQDSTSSGTYNAQANPVTRCD